jgi:co-chaperonin GroES (HSP10)
MNVRPLRDRVLVKRVDEQEQRVGGIIGTEIKLDGEDYVILREDEILGVDEGVTEPEFANI